MRGFVDIVNALGGVDVYVERYVSIEMSPTREGDEWHTVQVGRGWHHLNGLDALGYVRERRSSNDYVRMERQRCLLKAVAAKATPSTILTRFSNLSKAMASSVKTDIPLSYLPKLLENTASLDFDDIANCWLCASVLHTCSRLSRKADPRSRTNPSNGEGGVQRHGHDVI